VVFRGKPATDVLLFNKERHIKKAERKEKLLSIFR